MSGSSDVQAIGQAIRQTIAPVLTADSERDDARELLNNTSETSRSVRENILGLLAKMSADNAWSLANVQAGARLAAQAKGNVETPKAIATFIGECQCAMHPKVRTDYDRLHSIVTDAWNAETSARETNKDTPTPIRKAFSRKYQALTKVLVAVIREDEAFSDMASFVAYAEARDPDHDPKKVMKRLDSIRAQLAEFYADFPVGDINDCVEFLAAITADELAAARNAKNTTTVVVETPQAVEPQVSENPVAHIAPVLDVDNVLDGASDILDDFSGFGELREAA